jgi:hypothetical protein
MRSALLLAAFVTLCVAAGLLRLELPETAASRRIQARLAGTAEGSPQASPREESGTPSPIAPARASGRTPAEPHPAPGEERAPRDAAPDLARPGPHWRRAELRTSAPAWRPMGPFDPEPLPVHPLLREGPLLHAHGRIYVRGLWTASRLWLIEFASPATLPEGFQVLAAGEDEHFLLAFADAAERDAAFARPARVHLVLGDPPPVAAPDAAGQQAGTVVEMALDRAPIRGESATARFVSEVPSEIPVRVPVLRAGDLLQAITPHPGFHQLAFPGHLQRSGVLTLKIGVRPVELSVGSARFHSGFRAEAGDSFPALGDASWALLLP